MPWTVFWERNYFVDGTWLGIVLGNHAVRGAISGVGAICLFAALAEMWAARPWRPWPEESATVPPAGQTTDR